MRSTIESVRIQASNEILPLQRVLHELINLLLFLIRHQLCVKKGVNVGIFKVLFMLLQVL
jgi:hypothetical protein